MEHFLKSVYAHAVPEYHKEGNWKNDMLQDE